MAARAKFWGWGLEGEGLDEAAKNQAVAALAARFGRAPPALRPAPREDEFALRPPRVAVPDAFAPIAETSAYARLRHAYGKSLPDSVRMFDREVPNPPDFIVHPCTEDEVVAVLEWAGGARVAVVPYGGGSSVVGGVEPDVGDGFAGAISMNMQAMDRVLAVDRQSRAARIQAGALGPALEAQLKPHGLTLRHFPQSFSFSTLGGWLATRSGGHFATLYTHIDDLVECLRVVTPRGTLETRRLPGSGAGPSPDRLFLGSEGALGVITEAWMRLQDRPRFRAARAVRFARFEDAVEAVRAISQAGLYPANCRLVDADEVEISGAGDGSFHLLALNFESGDHQVDDWLARALECCADHGGAYDDAAGDHRAGAQGAWREAFINAPYLREALTAAGIMYDTFETAITWDRFEAFHGAVMAETRAAIRETCGHEGHVTCRFTHVYPDGPAPYYSFHCVPGPEAMLTSWREIKRRAADAVIAAGGTITHHHAVGRDHMPWYRAQRPALFADALAAAKAALDPAGVMNPGVVV